MEKLLPDPACERIMQRAILPHVRDGDLPGGIDAGVDAIIAALRPKTG